MMAFDPNKPVRTRDGREAGIVTRALSGLYPIGAVVADRNGYNILVTYTDGGLSLVGGQNRPSDLVNIPERHVRWVSFHRSHSGFIYTTVSAHEHVHDREQRIACIRVEFEDGEGL